MERILGIAEVDANGIVHTDPENATYTEITIEALRWAAGWFQAIKRVRELHSPVDNAGIEICDYCKWTYPCDTIKALDGEK